MQIYEGFHSVITNHVKTLQLIIQKNPKTVFSFTERQTTALPVSHIERNVTIKNCRQGCQLPDFVLYCKLFYYFFARSITKPPATTLEFKNFDTIFQKLSVIQDKNRKTASTQLPPPRAWAGLWLAVAYTLSTSRSFQTFLKHNFGNPDCLTLPLAHNRMHLFP